MSRWLILPIFFCSGLLPWSKVVSAPSPIRHFAGIRSLSRESSAMALPVEIEGVVIYRSYQACVVHDGTSGIYVDFGLGAERGIWRGASPGMGLAPGTRLKVEGVTDPGGFAPVVLPTRIESLGPSPLPDPIRIPMERMLSGADDGQRVVLEGVVQGLVGDNNQVGTTPWLMVDGQSCVILSAMNLEPMRSQFEDARVRVTGVLMPTANLRSQMTGIKLGINAVEDIVVVKAPPADPFLAPRVALDALFQFAPDTQIYHRIVTSGVISHVVPGRYYYLQNGQSGVRVESPEAGLLPGDRVDVAAFLDTSRILASLKEARTRVVGRTTPPVPGSTGIAAILRPELRGEWEAVTVAGSDFDGRVIHLDGVIRRVVLDTERDHSADLLVESEGEIFRAMVPLIDMAAAEVARSWIEGSKVSLTGVCELELRRTESAGWLSIDSFQLLLAGPEDLKVLQAPPWWTPARLAGALAALGIVLAISIAWVIALRRQVARRSARLAGEIAAREAASREFEATLRERRRLAGDLHDSLEQALTGLALQLDAADLYHSSAPDRGAHHLGLARKFLDRSRNDVRRTVWDLRTDGLSGANLATALRERATALASGLPMRIHVEADTPPLAMSDVIASNLLLASQEAITNAIKHSGATRIDVTIRHHQEGTTITIRDNGSGFDPEHAPGQDQGHFGLQGLRERLKRIGGSLAITSAQGQGTTITFSMPPPDSQSRGS